MKYIDANTLRAKITDLCTNANFYQQKAMEESNKEDFVSSGGEIFAYAKVLSLIDSLQQEQDTIVINKKDWEALEQFRKYKDFGKPLQQEQPDFPTTDEETEMLLATHPKVEVPNKYKTPDWLWKQQGQPEVDLEKEIHDYWLATDWCHVIELRLFKVIARYFYGLGLNARKEA